ncbi:hypothetical protein BD779DRAFT_1454211, partial [Infundibulicybe gibba]
SEIVRDNMIINMSGIPGKAQAVDENMEHNIGDGKDLFAAKGMYGGWDRLANISAAIDVLGSVKRNVAVSLNASYSGITHTAPDTSDLVWRVALKAQDLGLNQFQLNREKNDAVKLTVDTLATGERLLKSATLATFNKKVKAAALGILIEDELDEIPTLDLGVSIQREDDM